MLHLLYFSVNKVKLDLKCFYLIKTPRPHQNKLQETDHQELLYYAISLELILHLDFKLNYKNLPIF